MPIEWRVILQFTTNFALPTEFAKLTEIVGRVEQNFPESEPRPGEPQSELSARGLAFPPSD